MSEQDLRGLLELEKKFYRKLSELAALTQDLADAVDRQDQVSLGLMLSLREKAILELQEVRSYIDLLRYDFDAQYLPRFEALLQGEDATSPFEQPVVEVIAANNRLLQQIVLQDKTVNQRLCGDRSVYT